MEFVLATRGLDGANASHVEAVQLALGLCGGGAANASSLLSAVTMHAQLGFDTTLSGLPSIPDDLRQRQDLYIRHTYFCQLNFLH